MPVFPQDQTSEEYNGIVITHFGNEILIQDRNGERLRGIPRQQLPPLATGDEIRYEISDSGQAVILAVAPRHGILTRHSKQQDKLVAVNIDKVLIVCAAKPALKTGLIDRYLVACELAGLDSLIIFNKTDLLDARELDQVKTILAVYSEIGYPVMYVSAKTGEGIQQLRIRLENTISVLVGHSAVGKSSLIRALIPNAKPRIGQVSHATNKGRHTTTHSELYALALDSFIIDSPGVREFGLKPVATQQLAQGFREFAPFIEQCKFRDCTHNLEPGCAVAKAVADGRISHARIESYRAILNTFTSGNTGR